MALPRACSHPLFCFSLPSHTAPVRLPELPSSVSSGPYRSGRLSRKRPQLHAGAAHSVMHGTTKATVSLCMPILYGKRQRSAMIAHLARCHLIASRSNVAVSKPSFRSGCTSIVSPSVFLPTCCRQHVTVASSEKFHASRPG